MLIGVHVAAAVLSVLVTALAVVRPSAAGYRAGIMFTILTTLSGAGLIIQNHAHWLSICTSGLTFLAFALSGLMISRRRLAREVVRIRTK